MSVLLKVTSESYKSPDRSFKSAALYERPKFCLGRYNLKTCFNPVSLDLSEVDNNAIIKSPGIQADAQRVTLM